MKKIFVSFISIVFFFGLFVPKQAYATEFRNSDKQVVVASQELVEGTLFTTGDTITIDGSVEGDLFCAGKTILVRGSVGGDVICAGQTIRIEGMVGGNVRVAGQDVTVAGRVERSGTVFGQHITLDKESSFGGDVLAAGQNVSTSGVIGRSAVAFGDTILFDGSVTRDVFAAGTTLNVGTASRIGGTLTYQSKNEAVIDGNAVVGAVVRRPLPVMPEASKKPFADMVKKHDVWPKNAIPGMLVAIFLGMITVLLFPRAFTNVTARMGERPLGSLGIGLLTLLVSPVIFCILFVTILGIPIAMLYAMAVAFLFFVSKLFVALFVGKEIVASFWKEKKESKFVVVVIGVIISWLVYNLPYVGGMATFFAMLWGTGAMVSLILAKPHAK